MKASLILLGVLGFPLAVAAATCEDAGGDGGQAVFTAGKCGNVTGIPSSFDKCNAPIKTNASTTEIRCVCNMGVVSLCSDTFGKFNTCDDVCTKHFSINGPGLTGSLIVFLFALAGLAFAVYCAWEISTVSIEPDEAMAYAEEQLAKARESERGTLMNDEDEPVTKDRLVTLKKLNGIISNGATQFLMSEYKIMAVFMAGMFVVILVLLGITLEQGKAVFPDTKANTNKWIRGLFTAIAFLLGATTSIIAGWIGMRIAVYTNARSTIRAIEGYQPAFRTAFRGGAVMGFGLTSLGLLNLFIGVWLYRLFFLYQDGAEFVTTDLFSAIAAYGLGGSSIALFGRVAGGIFTKAADVGADLVGKVEAGIPEDDARNPGVIADCIGDNVGDIAGMGSDLFGSFAEATCAALVVCATGTDMFLQADTDYWLPFMYPLLISGSGLLVCIVTAFLATHIMDSNSQAGVRKVLKFQLIVSTVLMTLVLLPVTYLCVPAKFNFLGFTGETLVVQWWSCYLCCLFGVWSGLFIGLITEYYTSGAFSPVRQLVDASVTGAATNIIAGLALGYESTIIPAALVALTVYGSYTLAGTYGIALAALGILSTMSTGLAIDGYGPIVDNAGGLAEMSHMGSHIRTRTDALDEAGNTTAAIGKGYAIGSAAFVGVALYGAFLTSLQHMNCPDGPGSENCFTVTSIVNDSRVYFGLVVGAMLPYAFSGLTMNAVFWAANKMVLEIRRQFQGSRGAEILAGDCEPEYDLCVEIATKASLTKMIAPGALVVLTPIVTGVLFGAEALTGVLPGALISGIMMATSASNTGGAWDNCKKLIESGELQDPTKKKGTAVHHAAVIGDTVGDPLKDTSGPALNILVKLMAILAVVFAPIVSHSSPLNGVLFDKAFGGN